MADPKAKVVQFRRGTTTEHIHFIGALGELTVDTDKHTVVVHDGVTAGGYPLRVDATQFDRPRYLTFRAAIVQQGVPSLGFSAPLNAPTPIAVEDDQGIITGAAVFDYGKEQSIQDHFMLPDQGWVPPLDLDLVWRTRANAGFVKWRLETFCVGIGGSLAGDVFGTRTPQDATTAVQPAGQILTTTSFNIPTDTFQPGNEVFFRLTRLPADVQETVELISLRFKLYLREQ